MTITVSRKGFVTLFFGALLVSVLCIETWLLLRRNAGLENPMGEVRIGSFDSLIMDVSRRAVIVSADRKRFCSEPAPDAGSAIATQLAMRLKGDTAGSQAEGAIKQIFNSDTAKIFERSQGIQALRDGMYRLCEAFLNGAISPESYETQIGDLTATMTFIVPIELCTKLHREVIASLAAASADKEPKGSDGVPITAEVLKPAFSQACMQFSSEFATRLAASISVRNSQRFQEIREVRQSPPPVIAASPAP